MDYFGWELMIASTPFQVGRIMCRPLITNNKLILTCALSNIAVHMVNGIWGIVAVGLFATPTRLDQAYGRSDHVGWFYSFSHLGSDGTLLGAQMVGILFILGWVTAIMLPFFVWLDWKGWLRSNPLEEICGLDSSYHGGGIRGQGVQPDYITGGLSQDKDNELMRQYMSQTSPEETVAESEGDARNEHADQPDRPNPSEV